MRRLLKEAAELSRALDLIIATQGSDSPAVTPIIQQLSTLHRVLEDVYEESTGRGAIGPSESPNEGNSDIHRLEGRLDRTEEQFNDLKDSISRLVSVLGKKGGTVSPHYSRLAADLSEASGIGRVDGGFRGGFSLRVGD